MLLTLMFPFDVEALSSMKLPDVDSPALGVLAPGVFGYKDMHLDRLYPFDRAKAKAKTDETKAEGQANVDKAAAGK